LLDKAKPYARLIAVAAAGVLTHALVRFVGAAALYLRSPYSRDYGEGCVLMMVQLLHDRGSYFADLRDYPFVHGNYPPVFIALVWPFYAAFGPSLLAPRVLSLAATFGLAAVLFAFTRRLAGERVTGAAWAALALAPWFVQSWAPMGRVDMLALLLSVAGLWAAARGSRAWAFPLFWAAFFTKQSALVAPAAVIVDALLDRHRRRFFGTSAGFALPLAALFGALAIATHGEAYRHLVPYTAAAEYEWARMAGSYLDLARVAWPLFTLIVAAFVGSHRTFAQGPARLLLVYWLLSLLSLVTIAKAGAAQNYFIEPWLATVLLAAASLPALQARLASPLMTPAALLLAASFAHYTSPEGRRVPAHIRHPEQAADFQQLWAVVARTPGPVLSENLAVLVLNGKPVLVEPFGMLLLAQKGLFDPTRLVHDCETGKFPLIVAEHRLERIPGFGACLETRYEPFQDLSTYRLFRPRAP
jgi:hypothetical protein